MEALSPAGKDYLEAVLTLEQQGERVQSVDLSRLMGVTRASVSRAVGQLCEGGYLEMEGRTLKLTEPGRRAAEDAREKQRFFEQMLLNAGVGAARARLDAHRIRHAVSEESYLRLKAQQGI